jgi:hypothetical protein
MALAPLRIVDNCENTFESISVWRKTRPLFGVFREAYCNEAPTGQAAYGLDLWTANCGGPFKGGLVLLDDRGQELWLSGCKAGYDGTGPSGTAEILEAEAFTHYVELPFQYRTFHVTKDRDEPLFLGDPA